jgi:hypothetical protein
MLAIVFALVFLVRLTPKFADILTHSTDMYPPVDCRKNDLAKLSVHKRLTRYFYHIKSSGI